MSWSHYLKLMRIAKIDEHHFYEIESVKNDWSLTELKRQYDSSLYEPFEYKIFTELGHGGLAGEHPEQFLEEMIKAHE